MIDLESDTIPFPAPREPEPDWTGIAIERLDINKLPSSLRDSASRLLARVIDERQAVTRRIHNPEESS